MHRVSRVRGAVCALTTAVLLVSVASLPEAGNGIAPTRQRSPAQFNPRFPKPVGDEWADSPPMGRSIVDDRGLQVSPLLTAAATAPPPSPGLMMARTSYDYQHNQSQGYQTGRTAGADIVHFCWTMWPIVPPDGVNDNSRFVYYSSYRISTGEFLQPFNGAQLSLDNTSRGGYTNLAVDKDNAAHVAFHQHPDPMNPYSSWHYYLPIPGQTLYFNDELSTTPLFGEVLWPRIEVQKNQGGTDVYHMLAHGGNNDDKNRVVYWRYDGASWAGPVAIDSSFTLGYVIAADPNSDKVAIVLHTDREPQFHGPDGVNNVAYYESQTEGAGWINGSELGDANKRFITDYNDPTGPQAFVHISTAYDNSGVLQVIYDEQRQANVTADIAIRHWNSARGTIRTAVVGYWPNGLWPFEPHLSKMTLGIGDGATPCGGGSTTNRDYLYVVYTQFAGPSAAEQADYSHNGFYNGELYLAGSTDGGNTWSRPVNLTNTKTPNCNPGPGDPNNGGIPPRPDSVCRSEHWATIGKVVHDIYISDLDAGGIPLSEGFWELNPVMYLRLPGGTVDAPYLCPQNMPNFASSLSSGGACGFHADPGQADTATLTLSNSGNLSLEGEISVVYVDPLAPPANWLSLSGTLPLPFTIMAGQDQVVAVAMNAAGLSPGLYRAEIRVAHSDTTKPSPLIHPIDFTVSPCPCHADPQCDGATDILDVVKVIERAFRAAPPMMDSTCAPYGTLFDGCTDVDCSGSTDILDVVKMVDVAFRGIDRATRFCRPCG